MVFVAFCFTISPPLLLRVTFVLVLPIPTHQGIHRRRIKSTADCSTLYITPIKIVPEVRKICAEQ